ncbi:hypothetical protein FQR65_LT02126 [Abscondita terminalis]|nr:hypothetical protein FQR65_LT02126 [Abscondita terminalis]
MKTVSCAILFLAAQVVLGDIPEKYFSKEDYICIERAGIDRTYAANGINPVTMECEETERYKHFVYCWIKEMRLVNENDEVVTETWVKFLVDVIFDFLKKADNPNRYELSTRAVENCKNITVKIPLDMGVKLWNCIVPQIVNV